MPLKNKIHIFTPPCNILYVYFLTTGSLRGLFVYSSKWQKKRHRQYYCPISFISIIGKVFERIIYYQLFANLSDHIIFAKHQSGIHIGNVNAVALLDLKKAFDTVNHDILRSKLHLYSISGVTHKYFSSCLDNHTQKCLVNGSLSECCTFECGIPQGTILGPLLFLLYINDLPNCLFHFEQRMYVDDTHLTYLNGNIHSIQSFLNEDLLNIKCWLIANILMLSI